MEKSFPMGDCPAQGRSVMKRLRHMMQATIILLVLLMTELLLYAGRNTKREMDNSRQNYLDAYAVSVRNALGRADGSLREILYDTSSALLLLSEDEAARQYAAIQLQDKLQGIVAAAGDIDLLGVAETSRGMVIEAKAETLPYQAKEDLRKQLLSWDLPKGVWNIIEAGGEKFAGKVFLRGSIVIGTFKRLKMLMNSSSGDVLEKTGYVLLDVDGQVAASSGLSMEALEFLLREKKRSKSSTGDGRGLFAQYLLSTADLEDGLTLFAIQEAEVLWKRLSSGYAASFLSLFFLLAFYLYFTRSVRRELILPMGEMTDGMRAIEEGETDRRIQTRSRSPEFQTLSAGFNHLMDTVMNLKIESYEKELQISDTEEKYFRLQIKPHFFLNALTTISSLSASGKNREIEAYIEALSKNVRYMFQSGLHTVLVSEEIRHVENYFDMQELKYPGRVFHYTELPEELGDWKVPQMLIHTIVENEYKYALPPEGTLMVLIRVSLEGEELLIEIEDDGGGYPEEVLGYINGGETLKAEGGGRVGLFSIRRLLELMYDRKGLFRISNIEPHGALNQIRLPSEPVRERRTVS